MLSTASAHPCYNHCCYEDVLVLGVRNPQLTVCDVLWSSFPGLSINSDNLPFSYVILFLYSLMCHYMHET
jgi:hypothetical protein